MKVEVSLFHPQKKKKTLPFVLEIKMQQDVKKNHYFIGTILTVGGPRSERG